jgi:hypothetical protein
MCSDLPAGDGPLVEQLHEMPAGNVQEVGSMLKGVSASDDLARAGSAEAFYSGLMGQLPMRGNPQRSE